MSKEKILGVLGGLGPMATVYFYEMITRHTAAEKDQDHIDMLISSKASTPDRTAYILDETQPDPFAVMEREAHHLVDCGVDILAIPCNTAHYFYDRLNATVRVPVLNMVGDTVRHLKLQGKHKLGILATDGTVQSGTYQLECEKQAVASAVPSVAGQETVMELIYGIKGGKAIDLAAFERASGDLLAQGCDAVILGCTELSLVKREHTLPPQFVDSMEVLAHAAIVACGRQPVGFDWHME